jgi:hypothetical protein
MPLLKVPPAEISTFPTFVAWIEVQLPSTFARNATHTNGIGSSAGTWGETAAVPLIVTPAAALINIETKDKASPRIDQDLR